MSTTITPAPAAIPSLFGRPASAALSYAILTLGIMAIAGRALAAEPHAFLGRSGNLPAWNFSKYIVDRQGSVVAFFPSDVTPDDPRLRGAILRSLSAK